MGAHFARRLAEAGAQVAVGDVDEVGLAELPDSIARRRLDVTDPEDCAAFVAWARQRMGSVDALVNNAGIIRNGLLVKRDRSTGEVRTLSDADWHAVLDVNLTGAMSMTRAVVSDMVEAETRPGVIVNVSSVSRHGNRGQSNYVATKAAMAANTVVIANVLNVHPEKAAAAVMLSTLLALITVPLMVSAVAA